MKLEGRISEEGKMNSKELGEREGKKQGKGYMEKNGETQVRNGGNFHEQQWI